MRLQARPVPSTGGATIATILRALGAVWRAIGRVFRFIAWVGSSGTPNRRSGSYAAHQREIQRRSRHRH